MPSEPTVSLRLEKPSPEVVAIVTDIESVLINPVFFQDALYPYAVERLSDWLAEHDGDPQLDALLDALREAAGEPDADRERVRRILSTRMNEPQPAAALKTLHSMIWQPALDNTTFVAPVFEDAAASLQHWFEDRRSLLIYSPITVAAQRLLFAYSDHGNLDDLLAGYFDIGMGPPERAESFRQIAAALGESPDTLLMLAAEPDTLDAAAEAGWQTCWVARDEDRQSQAAEHGGHPVVDTLDAIELL